jgi:hypothetical protein
MRRIERYLGDEQKETVLDTPSALGAAELIRSNIQRGEAMRRLHCFWRIGENPTRNVAVQQSPTIPRPQPYLRFSCTTATQSYGHGRRLPINCLTANCIRRTVGILSVPSS